MKVKELVRVVLKEFGIEINFYYKAEEDEIYSNYTRWIFDEDDLNTTEANSIVTNIYPEHGEVYADAFFEKPDWFSEERKTPMPESDEE